MAYKRIINDMLALGYGSKYQLLRMLGWHRNDFNEKIKEATGLAGDIRWLDFGYNGPCDKELLNLDFIPELKDEWKAYWACGNGGIHWDAVGVAEDGTYILVEAKAHLAEMKSSVGGGKKAKENNDKRIADFLQKYSIPSTPDTWNQGYYQLANRLVVTDFLISRGYKAKILYVLFENGFEYNRDTSDSATADEWNAEMANELSAMGIHGSAAEQLLSWCIIDCNPKS